MSSEQEILDQIALVEASLEKSEVEVHKAVTELDKARLARSGKSADPQLREAADKSSERLEECRNQHLSLVQSLRKLNTELAHHRERQRVACQEAKHQYMRDHLPEAISAFQDAAVTLMALQGVVTENVIAADAIKYLSDPDLHHRALGLQAEMLQNIHVNE